MKKISIESDLAFVFFRANRNGIEKLSAILTLTWINLVRVNNERKEININQLYSAILRLEKKNLVYATNDVYHSKHHQLFAVNYENIKKYINKQNKKIYKKI